MEKDLEKEIETKIEEEIAIEEKVIAKSGKKRLTVFKTVGANFNPTEITKIEERAKINNQTPSGVVKKAVLVYLEDNQQQLIENYEEAKKWANDFSNDLVAKQEMRDLKQELHFLYNAPFFIRLIWLFTGIKKKK
jgi:hypothetical protein